MSQANYLGYKNHREVDIWETTTLSYFTRIFATKCAKLNYCPCTYEYGEHSKLLKLFSNSSTAYGHTKETSHWYLYFTLFMWHYSTKASNSEIPVLQMTCRACNIIQLSNFALYLSTERNYISLHMLWFIALCFVCAQRFLLRPLNHIATDGLQLALETHKKSFVKNKVN